MIIGANLIRPKSEFRTINFNYLKPLKMYTAIINNTFEGLTKEVHSFVFQTSRYFDFQEQVNSYLLTDDNGNTKPAVFEIDLELDAAAIDTAYDLVSAVPNAAPTLATQYLHYFDRAVEGVLGFVPLDPALSTEFNILRRESNNEVIAVLIRNPEPYNDPKIPLLAIKETIGVIAGNGNLDTDYKVLFSKDYAQVLIMHVSKEITASMLDFRFEQLRWTGSAYEVKTTTDVNNIAIP